jgi:transposase
MAAGKKNAARLGAHIVFADESGFLLIPTVVKTWAPQGRTPRVRHRTRREKVSAISAISVSPRGLRLGLYFRLYPDNLNRVRVCEFVRHLLRHLRGAVILLLDNSTIHHGDPLRALRRRCPRLQIVYFPGYAPELNPDEGIWNLSKRALANGRPEDLAELTRRVAASLRRLRRRKDLLRGCITHSGLPLFSR